MSGVPPEVVEAAARAVAESSGKHWLHVAAEVVWNAAVAETTPAVETIPFRSTRTITGEVFMLDVSNGRESDDPDFAMLENGEYLVGLHVRPSALAVPLPRDNQP